MDKTRIEIKPGFLDYFLEAISLTILVSIFIITIIGFSDLQDKIPTHFNFYGNADSFGNKNTVWLYPAVALVFYFGLLAISRFPHLYNYPVKVNKTNKLRVYKRGILVVRIVKILVLLLLFYFNLKTLI